MEKVYWMVCIKCGQPIKLTCEDRLFSKDGKPFNLCTDCFEKYRKETGYGSETGKTTA